MPHKVNTIFVNDGNSTISGTVYTKGTNIKCSIFQCKFWTKDKCIEKDLKLYYSDMDFLFRNSCCSDYEEMPLLKRLVNGREE